MGNPHSGHVVQAVIVTMTFDSYRYTGGKPKGFVKHRNTISTDKQRIEIGVIYTGRVLVCMASPSGGLDP